MNKYSDFIDSLSESVRDDKDQGICCLFEDEFRISLRAMLMSQTGNGLIMAELYSSWPHYSGDVCYPVPDPQGLKEPEEAFDTVIRWKGPFGTLRRSLCRHLASELRERGL